MRGLLWGLLWGGLLGLLLVGAAWAETGPEYDRLRREELSMSFEFYGKVVDLDNNPVQGAHVFLTISYIPLLPMMSEFKEKQLMTDENGLFVVKEDGFSRGAAESSMSGCSYRQESEARMIRKNALPQWICFIGPIRTAKGISNPTRNSCINTRKM